MNNKKEMQTQELYRITDLQLVTIYNDEFMQIEADDQVKFIYVKWLKHPNSEDFRKSFKIATELTLENKYLYWLSDARAIHYLEFADQNWMIENIAPLIPAVHLKKFARLSTMESIALMDVTRIYSLVEELPFKLTIELEVFTTEEAALEWLFPEA